jgi:carbon storage regulator
MLVLARKENQTVRIGHDIQVVVLEIHGNTVRLGVTAPKSVSVDRDEVYRQKNPDEDNPSTP